MVKMTFYDETMTSYDFWRTLFFSFFFDPGIIWDHLGILNRRYFVQNGIVIIFFLLFLDYPVVNSR